MDSEKLDWQSQGPDIQETNARVEFFASLLAGSRALL